MNAITLPQEILRLVFDYDDTFRGVFKSNLFKHELKGMLKNMNQSRASLKKFVERSTDTRSVDNIVQWRHNKYWTKKNVRDKKEFSTDLKIYLYPSEKCHTKYKIVRQNVDVTKIELDDFDGFICTNDQHKGLYIPSINDNYYYKLNEFSRVLMGFIEVDTESELYLHRRDKSVRVQYYDEEVEHQRHEDDARSEYDGRDD